MLFARTTTQTLLRRVAASGRATSAVRTRARAVISPGAASSLSGRGFADGAASPMKTWTTAYMDLYPEDSTE